MTAAGAEIRRATDGDVGRILDLRREFYATQIDAGLLDLPADLPAMLDRSTPALLTSKRQYCLVAEADGVANAYLLAVLRMVPGMEQPAVGSIEELYVAPALQRSGMAGRLVQEAVQLLREAGAQRIQTRVLADNGRARAFWQQAGFNENVQILELPIK